MTTEQPTAPATLTALICSLEPMEDPSNAPVWYSAEEASGYASGASHVIDAVKNFIAIHPGQFQSFTAEQHKAIKDVCALAGGYTQRGGASINGRAAREALYPITDPEGGIPAMAPYLTFTVTLAEDGSPAIASFDSLADARAFAEMKSAQGQRHLVRF